MNCYGDFYNSCYGGCDMKAQMQPMQSQMQPMQSQAMYPMYNTQAADIESMYPQCYYKIYPAICGYCDMIGIKQGAMVNPTREQLDAMVENICNQVEPELDMNEMPAEDMNPAATRQFGLGFGFGGRRFLRDIIGILLIRELLRRRPYGTYYPPYGSYYPGYYGY